MAISRLQLALIAISVIIIGAGAGLMFSAGNGNTPLGPQEVPVDPITHELESPSTPLKFTVTEGTQTTTYYLNPETDVEIKLVDSDEQVAYFREEDGTVETAIHEITEDGVQSTYGTYDANETDLTPDVEQKLSELSNKISQNPEATGVDQKSLNTRVYKVQTDSGTMDITVTDGRITEIIEGDTSIQFTYDAEPLEEPDRPDYDYEVTTEPEDKNDEENDE